MRRVRQLETAARAHCSSLVAPLRVNTYFVALILQGLRELKVLTVTNMWQMVVCSVIIASSPR